MSISSEDLVNIVRNLADRVEALESHANTASSTAANGATPRIKSAELEVFAQANPGLVGDDAPEAPDGFMGTTDVFVYDVSGRDDYYKDANTGLDCFWVQSKRGKRFLVDIMGVPMFLYNPLREQAYAQHSA